MSSDSSIDVRFGAQTGELNAGVDQAKSKIGEISDATDSLSGSLGELAGIIAAAFSIDKISEFVSSVGEAAKQLQLMSNLTGFSTTTIEALQYAIKQAGGNADAAGTALTRFERNLYDATVGVGPAYDAFRDIGVSLDDLKHKSEEDVFKETIDGLSRMTDASRRNADALAVGGRSFAAFASSLHAGQSAIDDSHSKLVEMGADVDPKMMDALSKLDTMLKDVGESFLGLGRHILNEFIGPLMEALGWVKSFASGLSELISIHDKFMTAMTSDVEVSENDSAMAKKWTEALDGASSATAKMDGGQINRQKPPASSAKKKDDSGTDRTLYAEDYDVKKEFDAMKVQSGEMSHQQEMADLTAALNDEQAKVTASFDKEMALYAAGSEEYKKLQDQKAIADEKFQIEHMKLTQQATEYDSKQWTAAIGVITKTFDQMTTGILQGTQTISQAFQKMAGNLIISFTQAVGKIIIENGLLVIANEFGFTQMAASLTKSLGQWQMIETQKTAASEAGIRAREVAQDVADESAAASGAAQAGKTIMQDAAEAAAAVYANVAQIPYVGWILAPPAAAAAFAAVAAYDSFASGTDYVPHDMLANIHQGEMIIPRSQADSIRSDFGSGGSGGGATSVNLHVHAMDAASVQSFFKNNSRAVSNALISASRGGHSALHAAFSRM